MSLVRVSLLALGVALTLLAGAAPARSTRLVKILLEFQQQAEGSRPGVEARSGVIGKRHRGDARARGREALLGEHTVTHVARSGGLFTVVQDGGTGTILMAREVPYAQMVYYHDYAVGKGYVAQGVAWQRAATSLTVRPVLLPGGQVRVTLTPRISYFAAAGDGSIEVAEASVELVVPSGGRVQFGGSASSLHVVTRQILSYREQQSSGETSLTLTATVR